MNEERKAKLHYFLGLSQDLLEEAVTIAAMDDQSSELANRIDDVWRELSSIRETIRKT